jgi:hypothetical protein
VFGSQGNFPSFQPLPCNGSVAMSPLAGTTLPEIFLPFRPRLPPGSDFRSLPLAQATTNPRARQIPRLPPTDPRTRCWIPGLGSPPGDGHCSPHWGAQGSRLRSRGGGGLAVTRQRTGDGAVGPSDVRGGAGSARRRSGQGRSRSRRA